MQSKSISETPTFSLTSRKTKDPAGYIRRILVEKSCYRLPYTDEILNRAGNIPVQVIDDRTTPEIDAGPYPKSLNRGKQNLFLCRNRGKFLKPCPATREYRCCDYQVLNIGANCPMDCVYCILQAYLNNPWLSFFVNTDDLLAELEESLVDPKTFLRIGTGEFTDSLALDSLTGLSRLLINFMRDKRNGILELKTKTAVIGNLRGLDHGGRTITAWSLNSPAVMSKEELRTATLEQRLKAAAQCASWGYRLAFHFDPIIDHPDWEEGYANTIKKLFNTVPKEDIAWISLGTFRFLPALRNIAFSRFPNARFLHEEFVPGLDGKMRYFRTRRVEMYSALLAELHKRCAPHTCIYLCMESDEIWKEVFGYSPEERGGLPAMLNRAVRN